MKNKISDKAKTSYENAESKILQALRFVADNKYTEALITINEFISDESSVKNKNIAAMLALQVLAISGYESVATTLLKALKKNFRIYSKEKGLCQRTIDTYTK